jgi:hypothetical protein
MNRSVAQLLLPFQKLDYFERKVAEAWTDVLVAF